MRNDVDDRSDRGAAGWPFGRSNRWVEPPRQQPRQRRRQRHGPVGFSLVVAALSISAVAAMAVAVGSTTIGVVACGGMVVAAWGLVLAELVSRYR